MLAVVDDQPRMARVLAMVLERAGHEVQTFSSGRQLLASEQTFDLVLTDLRMPEMDGVELLGRLVERDPALPVVVVTAHGSIDSAVEAMKRGAVDYLQKPVDNAACRAVVERALELGRLRRENAWMRGQLDRRYHLDGVVAESPAMQRVLALARRAAASSATVLIEGESGTGKEVLARQVHVSSPRASGPFEAINCAALPTSLLEDELFGHDKGAFTGAQKPRAGLFERAHGGTVFLDEIGEIDGDFQAKLLRVLQEGEVRRLGSEGRRKVDLRVVAATNRSLKAEVEAGRFREDLYYRLAVIPIRVPPLRERPEDVLPLARAFVQDFGGAGWSAQVERWMLGHDWPGNVRELRNTIERGVVLSLGEPIALEHLLLEGAPSRTAAGTLQEVVERASEAHVRAVLQRVGGKRVEAARLLGVEPTTLYRLMRKYGI